MSGDDLRRERASYKRGRRDAFSLVGIWVGCFAGGWLLCSYIIRPLLKSLGL